MSYIWINSRNKHIYCVELFRNMRLFSAVQYQFHFVEFQLNSDEMPIYVLFVIRKWSKTSVCGRFVCWQLSFHWFISRFIRNWIQFMWRECISKMTTMWNRMRNILYRLHWGKLPLKREKKVCVSWFWVFCFHMSID